MNKNNHLSHCIALCVGLAAGATAQAQPYSSIVAFGDSLTDSGQFPDSDPASPMLPTSSGLLPLQSLRLTNREGPNFLAPEPYGKIAIQYVSEDLGLGTINASTNPVPGLFNGAFAGTNYAIAGNTSDQILNSINAVGGSLLRNPADGSTLNQRDGYLVENPEADPNALYYVNGGANDLIDYSQAPMLTPEIAAGTAMGNISAGVAALAEAGANYIMVSNIPNIGQTALGNAIGGAGQAGLSGLTEGFNAALYANLSALDANIIPFDLNGLVNEVAADPTRFGFINSTNCFFSDGTCIQDPTVGATSGSPNPNALVFVDAIHPSAKAQRAIADYQVSILSAPAEVSLLPIMGLVSVESDLRRISNALTINRGAETDNDWRVNVTIDTIKNRFYNAIYSQGIKGDSTVLAVDGLKAINDAWKLGISASITSSEFDADGSRSNYESENIGLNFIAAYNVGRYQADLILNSTALRYGTITREASVGEDTRVEDGDTSGSALGLYASAAYDISLGGNNWQYGPKLVMAAIDAEVDGFTEYSSRVTALSFDKQETSADFIQPSLFARYTNEKQTLNFSATLGIRAELGQEKKDLGMRTRSLDSFRYELPGYEQQDREAIVGEANLTYMQSPNLHWSVQYRGQSDNNGYDSFGLSGTYNF